MIIISDLHLGRATDTIMREGEAHNSRIIDTINCFKEALLNCKRKSDRELVISGDIFNNPTPKSSMLDVFFELIQLAAKNKIAVFCIPGNHDCETRWSAEIAAVHSGHENLRIILKPEIVEMSVGNVLFIPHVPRAYGEPEDIIKGAIKLVKLSKIKPNILISHGYVMGAKSSSDVEIEAGGALEIDPDNFRVKLAILGHMHKHQSLTFFKKTSKQVTFIYPGSPVVQDFGEVNNPHGCIWINKKLTWHFIEFKTKQQEYDNIGVDLLSKSDIDLSDEKLKKHTENKLLKIIVYTKDVLKVNEYELRKAFNKFGKVMKFEIVLCAENGKAIEVDDSDIAVPEESYPELFKKWLETRDMPLKVRRLALKRGKDIIEKVRADLEKNLSIV